MKPALLFLLLLSSHFINGQDSPVNKKIDTIHSAILKEDRYIWVHLPGKALGISSYPVIYILDGQIHFDEVNTILRRISKETGKDAANEMIVVSIGNIWQRYKDYSPTHVRSSPWLDSYSASISGGGDTFISFLQNELFPHVQSKYTSSPTRMLIGHSMGGLIAMDILLKHSGMFDYYAVIDPSMWWDEEKLLNESKSILANKTFEKTKLFLAVANTMELDREPSQIKKDTSAKAVLIRPSLTLVDYINNNKQNKLKFDWKYYKEYHHMTVPAPAMYDALKFFLK